MEAITSVESQMEVESKKHLDEIDSAKNENERIREELQKSAVELNSTIEEITELNSKVCVHFTFM